MFSPFLFLPVLLHQAEPAKTPESPFLEPVEVIHCFEGEGPGDQFGWVASDAEDVDGDGVHDVVVGAPWAGPERAAAGKVYVYSGKSGEELYAFDGKPRDLLGFAVAGVIDANGDGDADLIGGAPQNQSGNGRVLLWSGKDGSVLHEWEGAQPGDGFGSEVGDLGDWDGNGYGDVLVGAPGHDGFGSDAGRVYLYSGYTGELLDFVDGEANGGRFGRAADGWSNGEDAFLVVGAHNAGAGNRGRAHIYFGSDLDPLFAVEAEETGVNLGRMFVSVIGDLNADGIADVYLSDWEDKAQGNGTGCVYLYSGSTGERLDLLRGKPGEGLGIGKAQAGDVNEDGYDDLIIGAWSNSEGGKLAGKAYLYSGKDRKVLRTITCTAPGDNFGFDATGMGDVNGDGAIDLLITSAWSNVKGPKTGRVFVIAGDTYPKAPEDRAE